MPNESIHQTLERKRKLEQELDTKISNDISSESKGSKDISSEWEAFWKNYDLKKLPEGDQHFWKQKIDCQLERMDDAINKGNLVCAMTHRLNADFYQAFLELF